MTSCQTLVEDNLNTSDHLPLSVITACGIVEESEKGDSFRRIDWDGARRCEDLAEYVAEVKEILAPFLNGCFADVKQADEIKHVLWLLTDEAKKTLPTVGRNMAYRC